MKSCVLILITLFATHAFSSDVVSTPLQSANDICDPDKKDTELKKANEKYLACVKENAELQKINPELAYSSCAPYKAQSELTGTTDTMCEGKRKLEDGRSKANASKHGWALTQKICGAGVPVCFIAQKCFHACGGIKAACRAMGNACMASGVYSLSKDVQDATKLFETVGTIGVVSGLAGKATDFVAGNKNVEKLKNERNSLKVSFTGLLVSTLEIDRRKKEISDLNDQIKELDKSIESQGNFNSTNYADYGSGNGSFKLPGDNPESTQGLSGIQDKQNDPYAGVDMWENREGNSQGFASIGSDLPKVCTSAQISDPILCATKVDPNLKPDLAKQDLKKLLSQVPSGQGINTGALSSAQSGGDFIGTLTSSEDRNALQTDYDQALAKAKALGEGGTAYASSGGGSSSRGSGDSGEGALPSFDSMLKKFGLASESEISDESLSGGGTEVISFQGKPGSKAGREIASVDAGKNQSLQNDKKNSSDSGLFFQISQRYQSIFK